MAAAASRIKGIVISIGGDTTELQKSLKKVDSALKTTEDGLEATILWIDTEKGYIVNIWSFSVPEKELMDLAENIRLL